MTPEAIFRRACALDVSVRKPGNVSRASPGHGMRAEHFIASADAASKPLCAAGRGVGERIDTAGAASWVAAGCNTNLGILLLCAPIAAAHERLQAPFAAHERPQSPPAASALRAAIEAELAALDLDDARHAFRAIARANPGGLGRVEEGDVREPPRIGLREAMRLAAARDAIARQYDNGFAEVFELGLPAARGGASAERAVQGVFLAYLATVPDSHIVRKRGDAVAQRVLAEALPWRERWQRGEAVGDDPAFAEWDEALKRDRINPGTSADLTVATLFVAGLLGAAGARAGAAY